MDSSTTANTKYPTPFYRVAAKALIFDYEKRLLVIRNGHGEWELPGGGWEHDESFIDCMKREVYEELCVPVNSVGEVAFVYRGYNARRDYMALRLAAPATIESDDFILEAEMQDVRFVARDEFMDLDFTPAEGNVADYVDKIWQPSD